MRPVFRGHLNIPEKVTLHDWGIFVTGFKDTIRRNCPLITGCLSWSQGVCPDHRVSVLITGCLSSHRSVPSRHVLLYYKSFICNMYFIALPWENSTKKIVVPSDILRLKTMYVFVCDPIYIRHGIRWKFSQRTDMKHSDPLMSSLSNQVLAHSSIYLTHNICSDVPIRSEFISQKSHLELNELYLMPIDIHDDIAFIQRSQTALFIHIYFYFYPCSTISYILVAAANLAI